MNQGNKLRHETRSTLK